MTKTNMQSLNRTTANIYETLPLKVMQFGGGNFLRAFVDWMIHSMNKKTDFNAGVVIIKPTDRGDYSALKSQEGLFHVVLDGVVNGKLVSEKTLVTAVQKIINPYTEWNDYLELAKNETIRFIISNTTEAGIKFNTDDKFDDSPPKEFPAKLTVWLYHRFQYFRNDAAKGCILLPCELIEGNGDALKLSVLQYADYWRLGDDFISWINGANVFCNTLVDRIVSGYSADRAMEVQNEFGFEDGLTVIGEYYHSWVIQKAGSVAEELPFDQTDLNVQFVDDLVPYREMKVRILNGAHTAMVPVGYLAGLRLVKEVIDNEVVGGFVKSLLIEEVVPTLGFSEIEKNKFVDDVLDRFENPFLEHRLIDIALNSTSKFVARLLPTIKDYMAIDGTLPKRIVFGLACLIRFYKGTFNEEKIQVKDDKGVLDFFNVEWKMFDELEISLQILVTHILENNLIWGEDLNLLPELSIIVTEQIENIEAYGVLEALKLLLTEKKPKLSP